MCPIFGKNDEERLKWKAEALRLKAEGVEDASVSSAGVDRLLAMRQAEKELNLRLKEK